ncbi:MAG: hypothetical protein EHM33_16695 [Chloroflexi bacterium]|nr:MAG: hypothetical protein EHM33_16695 [Chloroflexota bacterium]
MKKFVTGLLSQWRYLWKVLFFLYLPIAFLFTGVGILSRVVDDVSLGFFLRDIVATGKLPFFAGFVSQIGGLLWSGSLSICLFALIIMQRRSSDFAGSKRFFLQGGIVTGTLLFDDIFLFHEEIAPSYLHIGEKVVIAAYLIMGMVFVFSNWKEILSSEYLILTLALAMFGASILMDTLPVDDLLVGYFWEQLELFLEDGFKFAGIATWLIYFVRHAIQQIETTQVKI